MGLPDWPASSNVLEFFLTPRVLDRLSLVLVGALAATGAGTAVVLGRREVAKRSVAFPYYAASNWFLLLQW